ncbi:MAG: hypothetical protein IJC91_05305 [Oscillospiraceae bacterium]|nr:hypothetical protein [Oscillospiraceae bacterium]
MIKTVKVFEQGSAISDYILENIPQNVVIGGDDADFGIVMPGFCGEITGSFEVLLVPQKFSDRFRNNTVITYGMEAESMITLSSVGEERCVMTVQRELRDIWGKAIEPQDIVVPRMHLEPDAALAAAAALLMIGADKVFVGI